MNLRERIRADENTESVSREQVMRYWLREEVDEGDDALDPDAFETEPALREELFERKPIAERVFTTDVADWYHAILSEDTLRNLHVVVGEPNREWRAVADGNTVEAVARRIHEVDDVARLETGVDIDLQEAVELADDIDPEGPESRLLVVKEGDDPAYVADGNHRAVAHVLDLLRGGEFTGQEAYVGFRE